MTTEPKVSIVIPTCNRPKLLSRALSSVRAQTFTDFELIVIDDGDKVRAHDVVSEFHDARFHYVRNDPPRRGGSVSRNVGIQKAVGEYVAFLDDDDMWEPDKLDVQMRAFMTSDASVGFSVTAVRNRTDEGEVINTVMDGVHDFLPILLLRFKGFLTSALVVRKSVFAAIGVFDESLPSHQESDLLLRIAQKYKGLGIDTPLVIMNMETSRGEHIGGDLSRRILGRELLLKKHLMLYKDHPAKLSKHYFWLALWCRDAGLLTKAKIYFRQAFTLSKNPRYFYHYLSMSLRKDANCKS
jgi:glycosyltransferase involved in cell wall biosynthesis